MAEETGDVLFGRSAFGGFNRKDVMDYIDKLQRAAAEKSGDPDLRAQIARELDAMERENRCLRTENERLRAQLHAQSADTQTHAPQESAPEESAPEDESFSATAETVHEPEAKGLSMRDVDEMVQKYFGK